MKLTEIETILSGNYGYVRLHTDEGITGLGEGGVAWVGRGESMMAAVRELELYLKGKDPLSMERHWQVMYLGSFYRGGPVVGAAISAIDMALWDITGKYYKAPVYRLLGGPTRDKVRVYVMIGGNTPGEIAESATLAAKKGYTAVRIAPFAEGYEKMRYPELMKVAEAQTEAARQAVGDKVDVCLDVHTRLTPIETIVLARKLERYNVFFYEDPTWPENINAMADVAAHIDIPIATGEHLYTVYEFAQLLEKRAVHLVRPDPCMAGGITNLRKIAALAEAHYVSVVPHNPLSPVATAVSVNICACIPNFALLEYHPDRPEDQVSTRRRRAEYPSRSDMVDEPVKLENGFLKLPERPGIGIELNDKVLEKLPYHRHEGFLYFHEDGSIAAW